MLTLLEWLPPPPLEIRVTVTNLIRWLCPHTDSVTGHRDFRIGNAVGQVERPFADPPTRTLIRREEVLASTSPTMYLTVGYCQSGIGNSGLYRSVTDPILYSGCDDHRPGRHIDPTRGGTRVLTEVSGHLCSVNR